MSEGSIVPKAADFHVGTYPDGSGPKVRVRYDVTCDYCPDRVWLDGGDYSESWFAFDWRIADEMCAAIQKAAKAIETLTNYSAQEG